MKTDDPDRCPAGHDMERYGRHAVIQCQRSINHEGKHCFEEDHYVIQWREDETTSKKENVRPAQILLVDDNPMALEALAQTLRFHISKAEVNICLSAQRACEAIANFDYHLIIVDQCMPEMSGTDFITRIRSIRPTLPILLMSGYDGDGLGSNAIEMGANGFLSKPLDGKALKSTIEKALETTSRSLAAVAG
ncbi:MAG TPA: response regulator [Nitrospiraceae bacterium]|nr:response regulator [Nitrospiraceae bacterium]